MKAQFPKTAGNYLYLDEVDGSRLFAVSVTLPEGGSDWKECTPEEKEQWEKDHTVD